MGHDMNWRRGILHLFALCLAAGITANPACAQTRVGQAAVVQNEVVRVMGSATSQINVGDGVLRDEIVRTGLDSAARLVMADSTNLSLGPNATIKLDRTVFNDEHSYREIAIRLTAGAFRFVTGQSAKTATRSAPRWRRSACAVPPSTSCRSESRPPWCCSTAPRGSAPSAASAPS
jgi:hypothetical protein